MAVLDQSKKPYIQDRDEKQFIGIDLSFTRSEGIEGWFKSTETTLDAVKNNIRLLLMTEKGERLMQPSIGLGLKRFLFEQIKPDTASIIEAELSHVFEYLMPFISINNVDINTDASDALGRNTISIQVDFFLTKDPNTLASVMIDV